MSPLADYPGVPCVDCSGWTYVEVEMRAHQPYDFEPAYVVKTLQRVKTPQLFQPRDAPASTEMAPADCYQTATPPELQCQRSCSTLSDGTGSSGGSGVHSHHLCRDFVKGVCRKGDRCRFRHTAAEGVVPEQKGEFCRDFERGVCMRKHCRFLHKLPESTTEEGQ